MKTPLFNKIFSEIFNNKTEISRKKELIDTLINEDPQLINKNSGQDTFRYGNIVFNSILKEPELFKYIKNKNYPIDYSSTTKNYNWSLLDAMVLGNKPELFTQDNIDSIVKSLHENNKSIHTDIFVINKHQNEKIDIIDIINSPYFHIDILNINTHEYDYTLSEFFKNGHPEIDLIAEKLELDSECIQLYAPKILENLQYNENFAATIKLLDKYNFDIQHSYDQMQDKYSFLEDLKPEAGNVLKSQGIKLYLEQDTAKKILDNLSTWFLEEKFINLYHNNKDFVELNKNYLNLETQDLFFLNVSQLNMKEHCSEHSYKFMNLLDKVDAFLSKCSPVFIKKHYDNDPYKLNIDNLQPKYIFNLLNDLLLQYYIHDQDEQTREQLKNKSSEITLNYIHNKGKNIFSDKDIYRIKTDHKLRFSIYYSSSEDLIFQNIENAEQLLINNNYLVNFDLHKYGSISDFFQNKSDALKQYFSEDSDLKLMIFLSRYIHKEFNNARDNFNDFYAEISLIEELLEKLTDKNIEPAIQEAFNLFLKESSGIPSLYKDKEKICLKYSMNKNKMNEEPTITKRKRI